MPYTHQFLDQVTCPNNQNESKSNDRISFPSPESYENLSTIDLIFYPQLSNNQQTIHMEHAHSAHQMLINLIDFFLFYAFFILIYKKLELTLIVLKSWIIHFPHLITSCTYMTLIFKYLMIIFIQTQLKIKRFK